MKALVFLGLRHTILADIWQKEYRKEKEMIVCFTDMKCSNARHTG